MEQMLYQPLEPIPTREEAIQILEQGTEEQLALLPLQLGEYFPDWKFVQEICITLCDHPSDEIRANALLGLSYTARTQGKLEYYRIKPVLLRELRDNLLCRGRVLDAVEDINLFLHWRIGEHILQQEGR
ncbi:MAG: hypothetical protein HFG20_06770 [Anaerotruncus sp.]|nr:hypothetical protein [Anaerotruncus sp.]